MISKHTGTSVEDALVVTDEDILSGLMELPSVWEGIEYRCSQCKGIDSKV
jgi:hypothetical protein